jgi:hypothetical protein
MNVMTPEKFQPVNPTLIMRLKPLIYEALAERKK